MRKNAVDLFLRIELPDKNPVKQVDGNFKLFGKYLVGSDLIQLLNILYVLRPGYDIRFFIKIFDLLNNCHRRYYAAHRDQHNSSRIDVCFIRIGSFTASPYITRSPFLIFSFATRGSNTMEIWKMLLYLAIWKASARWSLSL